MHYTADSFDGFGVVLGGDVGDHFCGIFRR